MSSSLVADGADLEVRALPSARFACHACGACCQGFNFGPVEPRVIEGLKQAPIEDHWPAAAERAWYTTVDQGDGEVEHYLTTVEGRCIFLREDKLCAIHASLGAEAKPWFCRLFPFTLVAEAQGLNLGVRRECASWDRFWESGEPLDHFLPEIAELLAEIPPRRFEPDGLELLPGLNLPGEHWKALEARMMELIDSFDAPPDLPLAMIRSLIFQGTGGEEPDADREVFDASLQRLLRVLAEVVDEALGLDEQPAEAEFKVRFARRMAGLASDARARISQPTSPFSPQAAGLLREQLKTFLFTREFQSYGGLAVGLGAFLVDLWVCRLLTEPGADGLLHAAACSATLADWIRFSANPRLVVALRVRSEDLVELFLHNPALEQLGGLGE